IGIELVEDGLRGVIEAGGGNTIADERRLPLRVVDGAGQFREIAGLHGGGGDVGKIRLAFTAAPALVIDKEEGAVVADGAAESGAELVLAEGGLAAAELVVEPIVGVQAIVAEEFEGAAVERVAPGLDLDVDDAAGGTPELRRI